MKRLAQNKKPNTPLDIDQKAKAEFEKALKFAKEVARQNLYNPKNSTSRKTSTFSTITKENLFKYLKSPSTASNAKALRDASVNLYNNCNQYARLIDYYAGLPTWQYVMMPLNFDPQKVNADTFKKQYVKMAQFLDELNLAHEMRKASTVALRDGAFFGVFVSGSNSRFIQKLNSANCQICGIADGTYSFEYKMSSIKEEELEVMYPPAFTQMYKDYQSSGVDYQKVPDDVSFCLKADDSIDDYYIPRFASVMPLLLDIQNYMELQETATELQNYKLISGKIPLNPDGTPLIDWGLATQYAEQMANALPPQIGTLVLPWDVKDVSLNDGSGVKEVDIVSRATGNFWASAGTPPTLHGSNIDTSGGIELSIGTDEILMNGIVLQAQRIVNRYLKTLGGSVLFKIQILPITRYNRKEMIGYYKEASTYGIGKLFYCAALGIPQYDIAGLDYIETSLTPINNLTPLKSSHTMTSDENQAGRPQSDNDDLSDEGARSRDKK